jgi:hypothetical protein
MIIAGVAFRSNDAETMWNGAVPSEKFSREGALIRRADVLLEE